MSILDIYSRRKREQQRAGKTDVYQFTDFPPKLRRQICNLWLFATGEPQEYYGDYNESWQLWGHLELAIVHEKGLNTLAQGRDPLQRLANYLMTCSDVDDLLDVLELSFRLISSLDEVYEAARRQRGITMSPGEVIEELNFRLREAGVGYQFENGQIVRVDSQYVHSEVVKQALTLLGDPGFRGAEEEFLKAHALYRQGPAKWEDAIVNALKALESTLKTVCEKRKWKYPANATAAALIEIVLSNGLVPRYLESHLGSLRTLMAGLATVRNKSAGHGQGSTPRMVPHYLAAYALHSAASNIVFVVEAYKALP